MLLEMLAESVYDIYILSPYFYCVSRYSRMYTFFCSTKRKHISIFAPQKEIHYLFFSNYFYNVDAQRERSLV